MRWRRVAIRIVGAIVLLVIAYLGFTFAGVWRAARSDNRRTSDAIIVLGAAQYDGRPTAVLSARLDHAAAIYRAGRAPLVVVTGGKQPGDRFTEASVSARYLQDNGVPEAAVLRESTSQSSWESLAAAARMLGARNLRTVTLVSDPFHSLRIRLIAEELGLDAVTSATRTSPIRGMNELRRFATETLRVAVGRIVGFGAIDKRIRRAGGTRGWGTGLAILAPVVELSGRRRTRSGVV